MTRQPSEALQPHWRYRLRQLAWAGVDLLFPPRCGGCGERGRCFCACCQRQVVYLPQPVCVQCGYPVEQAGLCSACRAGRSVRPLAGLRSAAFFEGVLQKALHRLKYHHDQILADSLGALLARHWRATQVPGEMIVPVPLSAERLRERGYNQAALLARGLAELTNKAFRPQALQRVRHTVSQVGLSAEARRANVVGAFVADSRAVRGRAVLVIDDVCTTGSTLVACAEALRQAGATTVWGYTLGRARAFHTGSTRQAPTAPSASETFSRETSPQRSLRDREAIH